MGQVNPLSTGNSNLPDTNIVFFDRKGSIYTLQEIQRQESVLYSCFSDNGLFGIEFISNPTVTEGFLHMVTENEFNAFRDVVCAVVEDISHLFDVGNLCPSENSPIVWLKIIEDNYNSSNGILATGSSHYATNFYDNPSALTGIIDGNIWIAINAGTAPIDPNETYQGFLKYRFPVNWHTDIDPASTVPSDHYDLYTVTLHELIHALGFASLIGEDGTGIDFDDINIFYQEDFHYYSRYDLLLTDNNSTLSPLLVNNTINPFSWNWNPTLTTDILVNSCNQTPYTPTVLLPLNSIETPVYAPTTYILGSSLDHLYIGCGATTSDYVMHPHLLGGQKRRLTIEEVEVLCKLGYSITGVYGAFGSLNYHDFDTPTCQSDIPISCCGPNRLDMCYSDIPIALAQLALNHETVVCPSNPYLNFYIEPIGAMLTTVSSNYAIDLFNDVFVWNENTLTLSVNEAFIPPSNPDINYVALFRYVEYGDNFNPLGSFNYIRVVLVDCTFNITLCEPDENCNIINNFEFINSTEEPCSTTSSPGYFTNGVGTSDNCINCWGRIFGSPNYITNQIGQFTDENVFNSGVSLNEASATRVILEKDKKYILSFLMKGLNNANWNNYAILKFRLTRESDLFNINPDLHQEQDPLNFQEIFSFELINNEDPILETFNQVVSCFTAEEDWELLYFYDAFISHPVLIENPMQDSYEMNISCQQETIVFPDVICNEINFQYQWQASGSTEITEGLSIPAPIQTTNYTVTVSPVAWEGYDFVPNIPICGFVTQITVNVTDAPEVSIEGETTACENVILTASGGIAYAWSGGVTPDEDTNTFNLSGTYTVTVYGDNGCFTTHEITVTVNPLPTPNISGNTEFCAGGSTELDAGEDYTAYLWSDDSDEQTLIVTVAGTYSVTVTDDNDCTASSSVTVTVNPLPAPNITGNTEFCEGGSTELDAGGGYTTYLWSDNSNGQTLIVAVAGTYTVTVTDGNGCSTTDDITVTVKPLPAPNITGNTEFCEGGSTELDAGGGYTTYLWSDDSNGQTLNVIAEGNYSVTVTDENDCSATDQVTVTENQLPTPNITGNTEFCAGGSTELDAGGGYTTYLWSDDSNGQTLIVAEAGTYTVTVTDANGCTATDEITVTVNPLPDADAGNDKAICLGDNINLTATGGIIYQWNNGAFGSTITVSPVATTTYTVTVTDVNGCTDSDSVTITVNPLPDMPVIGNLLSQYCLTDLVQLDPTPSGGVLTVIFPNGNDIIFLAPPYNFTVGIEGVYLIFYEVSNEFGCTNIFSAVTTVALCCPPPVDTTPLVIDNSYELACCLDDTDFLIDKNTNGLTMVYDNMAYVVQNSGTWSDATNELIAIFGTPTGGILNINADIIIPRGITLDFTSFTVFFGPQGRIIVQDGAILRLLSDVTLDGLPSCNVVWQGIRVVGPGHGISRAILSDGFPNYGELNMNGAFNSHINNAIIGAAAMFVPLIDVNDMANQIVAQQNDLCINPSSVYCQTLTPLVLQPSTNSTDAINSAGGVIISQTGVVYNCLQGFNFSWYTNTANIGTIAAKIEGTIFRCSSTGLIYPFNVLAGSATITTEACIYGEKYSRLFIGNNNRFGTGPGFGIPKYGIRGLNINSWTIQRNQFKSCAVGASLAGASFSNAYSYHVNNNSFEECLFALQVFGGRLNTVTNIITGLGCTLNTSFGIVAVRSQLNIFNDKINSTCAAIVLLNNSWARRQ